MTVRLLTKPAFEEKEIIQAPALLDFYKAFHHLAYQDGVEEVVINFTGRSGNHSNIKGGSTYMWAGLQSFINEIIVGEWNKFFAATKEQAVADYKRVNEAGLGVVCDTSHLEALHDLGYMPLEFRGLLEGVEVPYGVAAMTCRNTIAEFYFLPNMIETIMSDEIWPVQTSLTTATEYMRTLSEFAAIDGTPEGLLGFLIHDFSMRGMMGGRMTGGAALSGMGHLMSGFVGSDTVPAALALEKNYGAYLGLDRPYETIASVNATEHSVQCSFNNNDLAYYRHCMKVSPTGILSLVSDGYDFWKLIAEVLPALKNEIMSRDGKIVIRPDSGDPADVICGLRENIDYRRTKDGKAYAMKYWKGSAFMGAEQTEYGKVVKEAAPTIPDMEVKGLIQVLWEMFGGTESGVVGGKVYKFLDSHIGAIYGDSITLERQRDIYTRLHAKGFAVGNIVLGVGSFTYQYVTRDTHGSAVKATNMILKGVDTPISKEVKGDAVKKSAKGRLVVKRIDNKYVQFDEATPAGVEADDNQHQRVWMDGEWIRIQTLKDVRTNVKETLEPA